MELVFGIFIWCGIMYFNVAKIKERAGTENHVD